MNTASKAAKVAGLKSLKEMASLLDLHINTLLHRFKSDRAFFDASVKQALKLKSEKGGDL